MKALQMYHLAAAGLFVSATQLNAPTVCLYLSLTRQEKEVEGEKKS